VTEALNWIGRPDPFPNEGLASFLRHFARDNFMASRRALLQAIDTSHAIRMNADQLGKLSRILGVEHSVLVQMAPSDAPLVPSLRRVLTRTRTEAVCPQCLKEASYSRRAWSHVLATACSDHSLQLVDQCPGCGAGLRHDRPAAHLCDCGHDLRSAPVVASGAHETEVAALLERRVPAQPVLPLDLSDGVPPDIDLFLLGLINHFGFEDIAVRPAKAGKTPAPRSVTEARERLSVLTRLSADWPIGFSGAVADLMRAPEHNTPASVSRRLGTWYKFLFRQFRHSAYKAFHVAAANSIVKMHEGPIDARMRDLHALATVKKEWFTVAEAARELGMRSERLAAGVDDGRIRASTPNAGTLYRQRFLHRAEVDRLREIRDDFCDESAAADILGVPHSVFRILKEAGLVQMVNDAALPPVARGCISRSDLQALATRLLAQWPALDPSTSDHVALRDLNLRRTTDRQRLVGLFRAVAEGSLSPIGHDGTGLAGGALFSKVEVQARVASFSIAADLTVQQVSDLLGVHYDAVKVWVDAGLLRARRVPDRQGRPLVIELRDLVGFLLEFTPLSSLAAQMGSSSRGITDTLARKQVPVMGLDATRGVLVRIRDMVRAEGSMS